MALPSFLASLNLMTLLIVLIVVGVGFAYFMRRRRNRHPLEDKRERNIARDLDAGKSAPGTLPPK